MGATCDIASAVSGYGHERWPVRPRSHVRRSGCALPTRQQHLPLFTVRAVHWPINRRSLGMPKPFGCTCFCAGDTAVHVRLHPVQVRRAADHSLINDVDPESSRTRSNPWAISPGLAIVRRIQWRRKTAAIVGILAAINLVFAAYNLAWAYQHLVDRRSAGPGHLMIPTRLIFEDPDVQKLLDAMNITNVRVQDRADRYEKSNQDMISTLSPSVSSSAS